MQLRQDGLAWHVAGDDVVVLDLDGSVYLKLNRSGRVLWERLAGPCTQADLEHALTERYGVHADRAAADVATFLSDMRRRRLLVE